MYDNMLSWFLILGGVPTAWLEGIDVPRQAVFESG